MANDELHDRANDTIKRLFALGDPNRAMANVGAFCALLKDLHARNLWIVKEPHVFGIAMVRAGILRGAIGTVMSCLDPPDPRGNRASVGQIFETLKDTALVDYFARAGMGSTAALRRARQSYEDIRKSNAYKRVKRLRDKAVAHTLNTLPPEVDYEDIYQLRDNAEGIVTDLYEACGRGRPGFLATRVLTDEHARIFWDTYFLGIRSDQ
jgi:hypothetical protein